MQLNSESLVMEAKRRNAALDFILRKAKYIFAVNVILSILVMQIVSSHFSDEQFEKEEILHEKMINGVKLAFDQYLHPLQGILATLQYSRLDISAIKFRRSAIGRDLYSNFGGALGFGFVRRVRATELDKYLSQQRIDRPNFSLRRLAKNLDPHEKNNELYIIDFVEPLERNSEAVGLVISDEKNRFDAAETAMLTGQPTLTRSIRLVQTDKIEPGFLYYLPIYKTPNVPETEEARVEKLIGWAYTPLLAREIAIFLKSQNSLMLPFHITQDGVGGEVLYDDENYQAGIKSGLPTFSTKVFIGGQAWIVTSVGRNLEFLKLRGIAWLLGLFLMTLSGLFYYYCRLVLKNFDFDNELLVRSNKDVLDKTEEINRQKNFIHSVLDGLPVLVGFWDVDLRNQLSNHKYEKYFGKKSGEVRGIHMSELFSKEDFERLTPYIKGALNGERQEFERTLLDFNGIERKALIMYEPLWIKNKVEGFTVIVMDITALRDLEEKNRVTQAMLYSKSKLVLMGEMAAGIAHEINNPLAIIDGKAALLQSNVLKCELENEKKEKLINNVTSIRQTVKRVASIIKGLRSFARDSESDPYQIVPLLDVINSTLSLTNEKLKSRNVNVKVSVTESEASIFCNKIQIEQVLMNLISNSLDAISNLYEKWIEIEVTSNGSNWQLRVTDSGVGIKPEVVDKMMNPFFTTKEVGSGTGLGLSICKGIIEKHNAVLTYDLYNGRTSFVILFSKVVPMGTHGAAA